MKRSWKAKATLRLQHRKIKKVKFSRRQDWGRRQAGKPCSEGTRSQNGRCNIILAVQESSIRDVVNDWLTEWVSESVNFWFQSLQSTAGCRPVVDKCVLSDNWSEGWGDMVQRQRQGQRFGDLVTYWHSGLYLKIWEIWIMTLRISHWQSENGQHVYYVDLTFDNIVRNNQICERTALKGMWQMYIYEEINF